ncbi:Hypothetical protein SRAE_2000213000 [Strongyloides ratti]|uniref:Uncharacterized protein n=1 Tax=Strongyloides ratti TaxID=34506 RepID=A0A090LCG9_STRRB|nr:Hypothetical protein SRAE_2000213000 [Strongyloides ratti]CEF67467.1 Hypothetical protein SRAE_2000213000 [Strongyloides ratti]
MVKIFSYHVLYEDIRNNLMKFMEKSFMPYTLMSLGSEMGCMYAETLIKIIFDLEDEENENFPSVAYEISLSLERIFKTVKERALTPGEKCFFVDIITSMGYDSFSSTDIFGRLNELKENLLKLVFLNERYNLTFKFEQFINLSKEDIGIHIIEKMFIQENDYEYIYRNIFKPYCEEFVLDFKLLICDFVQKWSTQQLSFTQDFQRGNLKDKIDRICNIIENIDDSMLQIKTLQHLVDAVSFEWPKKLTQSVYTLLTDTSISKDIKNNLADCCKLSNIRQIVKNYKDLSYDIKEIIKNRNEFEYFIQSLSVSSSSINVEILAKDIMKLCQLRHSYCKLSESFNITYDYIYEQLWIPHLIQWRYSEFEKKEPTQWLFNLPNNEAKVAVAKYSVEYLLKIYECGQEKLKSSEEIICYFKTLSVIKSFILNYLFKIKKYKLIFDKVVSIESLYSCFKILVPQTFFLETPKETANFINVLISNYNIEDWENMLKVIKITNMDNVLAYQYLLNACLENGKIGQVSEILFTLSFDRCLLTSKMISMIKVVLDKTFLKLYEAWSEKSFDIIQFSNIVLLALKVFMIEGNGSDKTNFYDIIAFSTYHKFLNTVINIVNSKDVYTLQDDTVEFMNTSDYINWELHSLSHLQKECKLDYYMAFNPKSKLFTRSCLQLPMNGEYNIETLLYIAASLVEYEKLDQIKFRDYIDGWKNLFNQLLIDGQFFDVFNLLEIYNTLVISKKENIYVDEIIKHSAVGLLERILLIPDCDLELATGLISTISERYIPSILQEIRNRLKTNTNPRVYINLCELVSMIYHKIPQIGIIEMLEKKYDESLWKRKFSKFGFNYSNIMTFNEIVSSLVRFNVPNNIAHEYCIYNNINFNLFCLQFALESCLYTSELLEMNDHIKYIEQLKKTSTLISGIIINEDHIILIQETIMKMSPYNHEGLLLLIDKLLQFTKVKNISDDLKYLFYNWKNVIDFLISYGKRSAEILSIECNWLSSLKLSLGNEVLSTTSFDSIESIQLVGEMSIIEFQVMEEERESARKRMPQCAIQRLPFHLLCCTSENEMKELVYPVVSNEINIHNIFKWINIIVNTKSILCFSQSECIITAIKKRIKYVEENNIFVGDFDRNLIISIINFIDVSNITTVVKYSLLYIGNLRNLIIKIAYLNIFKEVIKTNIKLLEDDKQEEFLKYEKELSKKIIKYSIEKILSDNGLFNQESKEFFYNGNINEMICFIYNNSIDWNNYQDRISKMKACKMITEVIGYDISSIHTTIIDKLLIQNTITQINDPDATINISDEVLSINQEVSNRFECDIWYDDVNVSQIVYILSAGNYNNMIKKMFSILNKDPKILPGGIITYIRVLICICRMYPRDGKKYECFKAKKSQVLTVLKGSYYYHMLSSINVNCKITDLINDKKMLEILKQLQNCPVHSMERDFVILNIIRDYLKKSPEYPTYMKTYIPRMIMGRQFFMVNCILSDTYSPITSDHMGSNILQFVLKTIEGILKQNVNNNDIIEDMLRFLMKHSISFGYSRPPRETGLFSSGNDMSKIAHYILNPTGN